MKPVLLLDVDGVLSSPGPNAGEKIVFPWRGYNVPFWPKKTALPLMRMAWELFDVYWLTGWRDSANLISDWAGLPHRPILDDCRGPDWKAWAAADAFCDWDGPVAWIEDGFSDEVRELAGPRGWFLVRTNFYIGATEGDLEKLRLYAMELQD